jgi:hypothetical protein
VPSLARSQREVRLGACAASARAQPCADLARFAVHRSAACEAWNHEAPGNVYAKTRKLCKLLLPGKSFRWRSMQVLQVDRTRVMAGDRPSGSKEAVQALLDEQATSSNGAGTRASNGAPTSLADVTITGPTTTRPRNGNGSGNGNGTTNGNGTAAAAAAHIDMDPCDAGQLEACAMTRITEQERAQGKGDPSTSFQVRCLCCPHTPAAQRGHAPGAHAHASPA